MASRRPLTHAEERALAPVMRRLLPRDAALIATLWHTGFRIHEVLAVRVRDIFREGRLLPRVGVAPRFLKGRRGATRYMPIVDRHAVQLTRLLGWLERRQLLRPDTPLFFGRDASKPLTRTRALQICHAAFAAAGITDDGRLGTHTFRKTVAALVYRNSGYSLRTTQAALGHRSCRTTQFYLEVDESAVHAAILRGDFTRGSRPAPASVRPVAAPTSPAAATASAAPPAEAA